jgi:uncharacterized membrane protein
MHLLCRLRAHTPGRPLPELRRRVAAPADSPGGQTGAPSGVDAARLQALRRHAERRAAGVAETAAAESMRPLDLALALLVVVVWGVNFAVIKTGVAEVPPLLLGALRFLLAACPAVFFLRPPKVPWRLYLAYGMTISVGQFAFLFSAIHLGMPSGLASLVLQSQAFFTMLFAALWLGESWRASQLVGLLLAACGLALIGSAHGCRCRCSASC